MSVFVCGVAEVSYYVVVNYYFMGYVNVVSHVGVLVKLSSVGVVCHAHCSIFFVAASVCSRDPFVSCGISEWYQAVIPDCSCAQIAERIGFHMVMVTQ